MDDLDWLDEVYQGTGGFSPGPGNVFEFGFPDINIPGPGTTFEFGFPDINIPGPSTTFEYGFPDINLPGPDTVFEYGYPDLNIPGPSTTFEYGYPDLNAPGPSTVFEYGYPETPIDEEELKDKFWKDLIGTGTATPGSGVLTTDKNGNPVVKYPDGSTKVLTPGGDTTTTTPGKDTTITKTITEVINRLTGGGAKDNALLAALLGGILGLLGKGSAPKGPVGYQGGIPKRTAVRGPSRSPTAGGRRPGGAGIGSLTGGVTYQNAAQGGLMGLKQGRYLDGPTDGMADKIETDIDGKQPARLSHGEFVIPADVVSHLGNGNSDAGADVLYDMMSKVRKARTGNSKQGKQINPRKYVPA